MEQKKLPNNTKYAIASILSPIIAVIGTYTYQSIAYIEIWQFVDSLDGRNDPIGLMTNFAILAHTFNALTIGLFIGVILAIKSIYLNKKEYKNGFIALYINGIPLIVFILISIIVKLLF